MKLENIKQGMIVKNYKEMCNLLGEKVMAGNSKNSQLKEWERYFEYHKQGYSFIIDNIFETPLEKVKNNYHKGRFGELSIGWKNFKNLNIKNCESDNIGVYSIVKDDEIYIGSTVAGFRKRFKQHRYGNEGMEHTKELIAKGGIFSILVDMTGIDDVDLIRSVEDYFIKYYENNPNWISVNNKKSSWSDNIVYKNIKVTEDNYIEAIKLLIKSGLIDIEEVL